MTRGSSSRNIFRSNGIQNLPDDLSEVSADIKTIVGYLPEDADKLYGWDAEKIDSVLDEYEGSLEHTLWRFWYERWSNTHEFININEAGTARELERIHQHAKDMLDYWQGKIDKLERKPIAFGRIERPTGDCRDC